MTMTIHEAYVCVSVNVDAPRGRKHREKNEKREEPKRKQKPGFEPSTPFISGFTERKCSDSVPDAVD